MITDGKQFDTNVFFSGGAGMFIQYHDVIKPVYLYAVVKMLLTKEYYGLPVEILDKMSILSMIEWYLKRRYINPLKCLDYGNILNTEELDNLLQIILESDNSIYKLSPPLNIQQMFRVYRQHHMTFPIYVYSKNEEAYIREDCKEVFAGINVTYVSGDLKECIKKCDQNFTYIFSDIELVKNAAEILIGTCSHVLLTSDYRYNYKGGDSNTFKYDLNNIAERYPFVRLGTTTAVDMNKLAIDFAKLNISQEVSGFD